MSDSHTADFDHGESERINAGYVWIEFEEEKYRTYYETAGDGDIPLLCLHTAGADSRQYRHLLNDGTVLDDYTVYAFDMPCHGQTLPPMTNDWWNENYQLTTDFYAGFVTKFAQTMALDNPVVLGCSMGGAIVLELARIYSDEVRSVIGLETTAYAPTRDIGYLDHQHINQEVVRPEWVYGLQAPQSPEQRKRESWWMYSQAGHGVYTGDLHFYANDWDIRDGLSEIDTDRCDVYLLTGEYDYSASPDDTRQVAAAIDGANFEEMEALGHFPMVENPDRLMEYLSPVLNEIMAK